MPPAGLKKSRKPFARRPTLQRLVRLIVNKFNPEKVILFGSYARGEARSDSDLDLLVVMKVSESIRDQRIKIRQALRAIPFSVDVLVTTPEDFAWRKEVVGTIEWPAHHEGRVLYARP